MMMMMMISLNEPPHKAIEEISRNTEYRERIRAHIKMIKILSRIHSPHRTEREMEQKAQKKLKKIHELVKNQKIKHEDRLDAALQISRKRLKKFLHLSPDCTKKTKRDILFHYLNSLTSLKKSHFI